MLQKQLNTPSDASVLLWEAGWGGQRQPRCPQLPRVRTPVCLLPALRAAPRPQQHSPSTFQGLWQKKKKRKKLLAIDVKCTWKDSKHQSL